MLVDYRKQLEAEERCLNDFRFEKENVIGQTRDVKKKTIQIADDSKRLQVCIINNCISGILVNCEVYI